MALQSLTIIPAGAGSGKTYKIQKTLAQWIQDNEVSADRVVAVTFTEAAATELRGRIRDELINSGHHADALKLDQAYISTIHGFGLRVLTEFAFDAGMNPTPRMLSEDEEKVLIRLALASDDSALHIMKDLARFGYKYDFNSKKGPEEQFRDVVLTIMNKLRSIGCSGQEDTLAQKTMQRIEVLYGAVVSALTLTENLSAAIQQALTQFPQDVSAFCKTTGVQKAVADNHVLLYRAAKQGALTADWQLWQQLRELQLSSKRNPLPDGYDEVMSAVIAAADGLLNHPGPLQDALGHAEALITAAHGSLGTYARHKQEKGLLDFTDMLALAQDLLQQNPAVLSVLTERFQCLIIDEFQDTNPLQFSLLWLFHQAGIPTLIVGDVKQAIMGFQNADSRLLTQMQLQHADSCSPLTGNWRTCAPLMKWVNDVGSGLFAADYTVLQPNANFPSTIGNLEAIAFNASSSQAKRASHTVARIKDLLDDETSIVYDRHTRVSRRLRGGDIAVICPRNKSLVTYARLLRRAGIAVQMHEDGWFQAREVQLLYYAVCYVADPSDRHADLYLAVTELGDATLESALKAMLQEGTDDNTELRQKLDELAKSSAGRGVESVVQDVAAALDLYGSVSVWPRAAQARANLLRFEAEARDFELANREALASAGYYGCGLKTFLAWLTARVEQKDGNVQPQPCVKNEDAVELVSWHRSKGREWPVVVVADCDSTIKVQLPDQGISYDDFNDLGAILQKSWLSLSPEYVAPEKNEPFLAELETESYDSAKRLLYVALTRAREKIILEWPQFLDNGKERKTYTYWELLTATTGLRLDANVMSIAGHTYPCRVVQVGKDEVELSADSHDGEMLSVIGRRAIKSVLLPTNLTPESVQPSVHDEEHATIKEPEFQQQDLHSSIYAGPLVLDFDLPATQLGTLVHRCYEVLLKECSQAKLERATGYAFTLQQYQNLCQQTIDFYAWLNQQYQPDEILTEVPILATDANGSVINGFIDLLIETAEGYWIIDHKTDQTDDLAQRFDYYLPQLQVYAEAITQQRTDKPVLGVGINWVRQGVVLTMA